MPKDDVPWPLVAGEIRTERLTLLPLRVTHAARMARVLADPALHTFIGGAPSSPGELRARYERMLAGPGDPAVSWCNWVIEIREPAEDGGPSGGGEHAGGDRPGGGGQLAGTVQATVTASVAEPGAVAGPLPGPEARLESGGGREAWRRMRDRDAAPDVASGPGLARTAELAWVVGTAWQGRGIATEAARGLAEWLVSLGVGTLVAHVHPDHVASAAVAHSVGLVRTDATHDGEERWGRRTTRG